MLRVQECQKNVASKMVKKFAQAKDLCQLYKPQFQTAPTKI